MITRTIPVPATPPTTPPAVPAKLRQRILHSEYIDFDLLLPESMFTARFCTASMPSLTLRLSMEPSSGGDGVVVVQPRPVYKRSVSNLSSWLEAWNGYVATLVSQYPYRVASLLAYQWIICQASLHSLQVAWLQYDSRFRTPAAEDKSLRWDHKLNDLWLECFSLVAASPSHAAAYPSSKARRPCTYCGATTHYPDNCSSNPFRAPRSSPPTFAPSRSPASFLSLRHPPLPHQQTALRPSHAGTITSKLHPPQLPLQTLVPSAGITPTSSGTAPSITPIETP